MAGQIIFMWLTQTHESHELVNNAPIRSVRRSIIIYNIGVLNFNGKTHTWASTLNNFIYSMTLCIILYSFVLLMMTVWSKRSLRKWAYWVVKLKCVFFHYYVASSTVHYTKSVLTFITHYALWCKKRLHNNYYYLTFLMNLLAFKNIFLCWNWIPLK